MSESLRTEQTFTRNFSSRRAERLRPLSEANGLQQLIFLFGEQGMYNVFGMSQKELEARARQYVPRKRTMDNVAIDQVYDNSFLKIHSIDRDIERFQEAIQGDSQKLRDEIAGIGIPGFGTLLKEYLFGKNTFFYNKVVYNPESGEYKIVAYDPMVHSSEVWKEAWKREDLRVSYRRFIDRKSEEDPLYRSTLQYRDDSELGLMEDVVLQAKQARENKNETPVFMSLSPAPRPSRYAREMGYASWLTKRLSHWRSYSFEPDAESVIVRASTVFTYRNINRMRHLMKEVVHTSSGKARRIRRLSFIASDKELLSLPFESQFTNLKRSALLDITCEIDRKLNLESQWYDHFFVFSQRATQWHNSQRLTDTEAEQDILQQLYRTYAWEYFALMLEFNGNPDPYLLKEVLIQMREKAMDLYGEHMSEAVIASGGDPSAKARFKTRFIREAKIREKGGNCPTIRKRKVLNADGEEVWEDELDENAECLLVCLGKKIDSVLKMIVSCVWKAWADKDKVYHECPECGWFPGKVQTFDFVSGADESTINLESKSRKDQLQLENYVSTTHPGESLIVREERQTGIRLFEDNRQLFSWNVTGRYYYDTEFAERRVSVMA
ncbi:MAG: hypothetical protein M3Q44_05425 [bacterium]|nr:hypothetical protein [bacterium]